MIPRSAYRVVKVTLVAVWIEDTDEAGNRSVTNDAERVVAELFEAHGNARFFYRDSMGTWDELLHERGRFTDYKPGAPSP